MTEPRSARVVKAAIVVLLMAEPTLAQGPAGYAECDKEQDFAEPTNVAMGTNGTYKFLFNQIGPFQFGQNHEFFAGGANATENRSWCQTISNMDVDTPSLALAEAFTALEAHIDGSRPLTSDEINAQQDVVRTNMSAIGIRKDIIQQSFDLVDAYETTLGPLFMNQGGTEYPREQEPSREIHYAMLYLQDAIIRSYSSAKLDELPDVYSGARFQTADYFPGHVAPPVEQANVNRVMVNASQAPNWGTPIYFHRDVPSRRPTGSYVAPGSLVKIKVPSSVVGKGYTIRVGAHYWDLSYRETIKRLDRAAIIYPILSDEITVGSPIGGNIYFEVPEGADGGDITLEITGAVRAPFFSAKTSHSTSLSNWQDTERHYPGAWADFESDKFLVQVPSSWIRHFDDPVTMMRDWDTAMDAINDLLGKPRIHGTHNMYMQVDVIMRVGFGAPGYPMVNHTYDPAAPVDPTRFDDILRGPQHQHWVTFHELGHSHFPGFFEGEIESIVNLLVVAILNQGFSVDLEAALGRSVSSRDELSLDDVARSWMITASFRGNDAIACDEMQYQHRGHAKYVDVARLFGWGAIGRMNKRVSEDYNNGLVIEKTQHPVDDRIWRMSVEARADLRPLLHFWGQPPEDNDALSARLAVADIPPSQRIYDALDHYLLAVPQDLAACQRHAKIMYPEEEHPVATGVKIEQQHAFCNEGWSENDAEAARTQIRMIQDAYFPDGRPEIERLPTIQSNWH